MAKGMYLEHYLDSIEGLPCELQRNFSLMGDLDNRTEEKKEEINELAAEYVASARNLASEERVQHLKKIENAYNKCKEYSDDKVQLAMQIYEMVDKHIRRLDADLARFENDLQDKLDSGIQDSSDEKLSRKDKKIKEKKGSHGRDKKESDQDSPKHKRQKNGPSPNISEALMHPSDVLDMPVDPNEPTYCLCSQVSYGEMIGCDNADCPIEWFHFTCVGLTTKPKGKWYCPRCIQDMRKK
ncbi:inhibitor of growth protein 5b [Paramisgurnus dabryanus]|uniref:inhibitor of growth protein 5b n=1 Tax=Paramisgurnus dabryanus TaxID=90735 RepID=UPI0031F473E8